MSRLCRTLLAATTALSLVAPLAGRADPIETNPLGPLTMTVLTQPIGTTPGTARLTIRNATRNGGTVYFGLRLMGSEDVTMGTFSLPSPVPDKGPKCTVSDFAGRNTAGWQGDTLFGTSVAGATANAHMRMVGGWLRPGCGDLTINISYRLRPLVVYYAAFFGANPAPWHKNYGTPPWTVVPTGGDSATQEWWNLWGSFDTLGYSNACVNVAGTAVTC